MTSNSTIVRPKWIAAAAVMIFMISAAAVCCDTASAAGNEEVETIDVDKTFTTVFSLVSFFLMDEPTSGAKVISGPHDVSKNERYDELVLDDGAVLNFSNSARMTVGNLFIDGNVKFVNTDGSDSRLYAESVFLSGYMCLLSDTTFYTDKSVTIDSQKETTGFYDLETGELDFSKGMVESVDAKIYTDGYIGFAGKSSGKVYSGNGAPAVELFAGYDLDGFYDSLKKNLDGLVIDESAMSKISDYIVNKMVYPEIDLALAVAKISNDLTTMSDVEVSFVSSQADGDVTLEMSVGSSEGDLECEKLKMSISGSLTKAEVSGSAGHLVAKRTGTDVASANQNAEFKNLKFSISSAEKDIIPVVMANILDGPQAVIDALADSDAEFSGTSYISADSVKGAGSVTVDGVTNSLTFDLEGFEYSTDVDTNGSAVKGSASLLDVKSEGSGNSQWIKITDISGDLTSNGKNAFSILKLIPLDDKEHSEADYVPAIMEFLDGLSIKGDVCLRNLDQRSISGTVGLDYEEVKTTISGDSMNNFQSALDLKFSADKDTGNVGITGTATPAFSGSALGYGKVLISDDTGVNGNEVTLTNIKMETQAIKIDTTLEDLMNGVFPEDLANLSVAVDADVEKNSWSTGTGSTAYAEKIVMKSAEFDTNVSDLMEFSTVDLPASAGDALRIDSYDVSDRGTGSMLEFADVVAKADGGSTIKGSSYEFRYDESGKESLYIADTETVIDGTDTKYKETSDVDSVAYLVKNEAGYYEVVNDVSADSVPIYNVKGKEPSKSGDNTMLYVAIAVIAIVLIALIAYFLLKKRSA